jgi:hypothetical protein
VTSSAERAAFVDTLGATATIAIVAAGQHDVWVRLGTRTVCLRFAGDALVAPMSRALAHLRIDAEPHADLTVWLWDSVSTGTQMPPPPWGPDAYLAYGAIRGFFDDDVCTVLERGVNALTVLHRAANQAYFWIRDARLVPSYVRAAPLRTLFHLWSQGSGEALVHAAAVGDERGCVLLIGPSGAGKSTTAVACMEAGMGYVGDDYCLVQAGCPPRVSTIYSSAKLADPAREEKAVVYLAETSPTAIASGVPVRAVVLPRVGVAAETTVRRATAADALVAAGPSTLLQHPGSEQAAMTMLASVLRSVPCWFLDVGPEPASAVPAIAAVLA